MVTRADSVFQEEPADMINPCGAEARMRLGNWVNVNVADALAPCVTKSSEAIVLTIQDDRFLVFYKKSF